MMRRYEENKKQEEHLDRIFSFLRNRNQGDIIRIKDKDTDEIEEVTFIRRGRLNVSVFHGANGQTELVAVDRVVI
jgi:hypothetical protein